jgi:hypothetical protein
VSKDKKKKKKRDKKDHADGSLAKNLKSITENPLVGEVVAAALVAMASALKDSNKARKFAADAGEQLGEMAKGSADKSGAMWQLALDVGRRTLEALAGEEPAQGSGPKRKPKRLTSGCATPSPNKPRRR